MNPEQHYFAKRDIVKSSTDYTDFKNDFTDFLFF
jgi:hypothetical protein